MAYIIDEGEIKGVAFDWFGVCGQKLIDAWEDALGLPRDSPMRKPFFAHLDSWATSEINGMAFLEKVLPVVGLEAATHDYLLEHPGVIYTGVLNAVRDLRKAGYRTALISDNFDEMVPSIERCIGGFREYFGTVVLSNERKMTKKNPAIFEVTSDFMCVPNVNILFIDDKEKNLEVAAGEGYQTLLCDDPHAVPRALRQRGLEF
ncbi:hypothetical protein GOV07_03835 [Candidatus Woesearchaeota archaeon]|nr:hypothetical protein [Candidatus Woesearchaeota archaeon]